MLPSLSVGNLPNNVVGQVQFAGNGVYRHGFVKTPDTSNVRVGYCTAVAVFAAIVVRTVFALFYVLKIAGMVIESIFINMMYLASCGTGADESKRNKLMNIEFFTNIVSEKPKVKIAVSCPKRLVFAVMRLCPSAFGFDNFCKASNVSKIANLVKGFVSGYIAPFLGLGIRGNVRGMIGHVISSLLASGRAPGCYQHRRGVLRSVFESNYTAFSTFGLEAAAS